MEEHEFKFQDGRVQQASPWFKTCQKSEPIWLGADQWPLVPSLNNMKEHESKFQEGQIQQTILEKSELVQLSQME